ncbi:MAG: FtsH protease activity modulator HflK [Rickettsiales bacterium]|nr:FtsH protease activity modulator HflK [Rickettsiales bacterium]|tara:strand:- start:86 stop:1078 length:993 start_codon:yes stop_codon:yes gene_type:complete
MATEDNIFQQLEALAGGRGAPPSGKPIFAAVLVVVALVMLNSTFYTVEPEEVGVILRFGQYERVTEPGLRLKLPNPIETVTKVPIQRQLKEEFGFRTRQAGVRTSYEDGDFRGESLMLTGDLNVAVVQWIAQYRVRDPYKFLFKVRGVRATFRDLNEAVMRQVVGDRTVNEVLTVGRQSISADVKEKLQVLCDQYDTGIKVEQIVLQDVNPPDPVKPSFNEVNQAQQERERLINEAETAFNQVIPRARGEAQQVLEEARGYATDRINRAEGDALAFTALHEAYRRAPEVTRQRIYLETMAEVFPKVREKIIVDGRIKGILPMLNLDQGGK